MKFVQQPLVFCLCAFFAALFALPVQAKETSEFGFATSMYDASRTVSVMSPGTLELREWLDRIEQAVARHPAVLAQVARRDGALAAIDEARALLFPRVSISGQGRSQRSVRDGERRAAGDPATTSDAVRLNPSLNANQLLFDGGARGAAINAAQERATASEFTLGSTAQAIALRAARTMADLARLQQQRVYAENNLKEVRRLRNMIEQRVQAGRDAPSEMPRMESRVSEALISLSTIESSLKTAQASHEEVFGEPPLVLALPSVYVPVPETENEAIDLALRLNADLLQAESAVTAARFDLDGQKAGRWPSVSLEASASGVDSTRQSTSKNYDSFLGFRVSADLFDGGSRSARIGRASQALTTAEQQLTEVKSQLISSLRSAYANRESLVQRFKEVKTQQERDRETQKSYEEQFLVGRRPLNDLISAQRETYSSALQQASIEAEVHLQHFIIRSLIGDLRELAKSLPN